jgi:hypothetical protein
MLSRFLYHVLLFAGPGRRPTGSCGRACRGCRERSRAPLAHHHAFSRPDTAAAWALVDAVFALYGQLDPPEEAPAHLLAPPEWDGRAGDIDVPLGFGFDDRFLDLDLGHSQLLADDGIISYLRQAGGATDDDQSSRWAEDNMLTVPNSSSSS